MAFSAANAHHVTATVCAPVVYERNPLRVAHLDAFGGWVDVGRVASSRPNDVAQFAVVLAEALPLAIRAEWLAAVEHAGMPADRFRIWLCPPPPQPPPGSAAWIKPGYVVPDEPDEPLRGVQREQANAPENRDLHRIMVIDAFDPRDRLELARLAGRFRHEIEHAVQWDYGGGEALWELDLIADQVIQMKVGPAPADRVLYRRKPREEDANAAASQFLRERHPDVVDQIAAGEDAELVRSLLGPPDPRTLIVRTVCFQYLFNDLTEGLEDVGDWAGYIDTAAPGTGAVWIALQRCQALLWDPPGAATES
jgi:hypothetical protein